jgi:Berberine and berberine like
MRWPRASLFTPALTPTGRRSASANTWPVRPTAVRSSRVCSTASRAGAYNRVSPDATAFVHRSERFLLKHDLEFEPGSSPDQIAAGRRWLTRSWSTVHPWGSGGVYPNFPDPELDDPDRAYYGSNTDRLDRVRRRLA